MLLSGTRLGGPAGRRGVRRPRAASLLSRPLAPAAVIGAFPWDPFPPGEPEPKGPDPVQSRAFRAAVTAADAYRSVRLALRREQGTLRVGNRFVADGRYREVAFLAAGHAANSMALAALHVLGDRLTQGFVAGPEPVLPELPFRGVVISPGWGGSPSAPTAVAAAREIAGGLTEQDLLLVLLSPGAVRALAMPPVGMTDDEFSRALQSAYEAGATGREVGLLTRVLGTGGVGGRLAGMVGRSDVATFVVERGDGPLQVGGGPMEPVLPEERTEVRAVLERLGPRASFPLAHLDPPALREDRPLPSGGRRVDRPVLVAGPSDALRAAADAIFEKGWTSRLAFLEIGGEAEVAAGTFVARTEELIVAEALTEESRTKGLASFAMTTLGLPEGVDEGPGLARFLGTARGEVRRREMSVGLFRTAGAVGSEEFPAGAVIGAPTDPKARERPGRARAVPMRTGITDVGLLAVALYPTPAGARPKSEADR